ncbi:alpha/beta fold hydrolase [Gephyromycinifex aptenodytis]|uniref:alpha/beta fold hydrolase n=1 Tax=Gephyromycinifex aptenodytis TaxID=2716227 RepID=UPI0014487D24|nr:alpha/beta fold hydrolase [Gephyromycinifex aptenodytis]
MSRLRQFTRDKLQFDVLDAGPLHGTPVVLLHGFPQDATAWSEVTSRLATAELRTLAPHLRGYSPGARPTERSAYRLSVLVGDVVALLDAAGLEKAHLVGHDWGGGLAWATAARQPHRVASLTVLSTPHPAAMAWAARHSTQALKSWYMLAMQLPVLPEVALRQAVAAGALKRLGLPPEHADAYAQRLLQPGALTGAVGWYRGMLAASPNRPSRMRLKKGSPAAPATRPSSSGDITVPTTYVWGRHDPYLGRAAALRTARHCTGDYRFVPIEADHWLPEKQPDLVAREIIARAH